MKFIHLVPVLGIAALLGAAQALPSRSSHALVGQPSHAGVVPPWLVGSEDEAEPAAEPGVHVSAGVLSADGHVHDHDAVPHADHVHAEDPHGVDPHAGAPHAELCAAGYGADDPHAELCAAGYGDPHATEPYAGDPDAIDPHAGLHAAGETGSADEDPYERVGLAPAPPVSVAAVERSGATNGHTVAEIHASRQKLAGQTLRVRGTVVKLNEGILGQTYLHLRDGSGSAEQGDDDLTVTTTEPFQLGETVELSGELAIDRDVGAGYVYAALLTNAARVPRAQ